MLRQPPLPCHDEWYDLVYSHQMRSYDGAVLYSCTATGSWTVIMDWCLANFDNHTWTWDNENWTNAECFTLKFLRGEDAMLAQLVWG